MKKTLLLLCLFYLNIQAQDQSFNCDYNAYLFQYNDVYAVDLASGNSYIVAKDITAGNINAAAYNSADGYIWGSLSSPSKTIVRIGKNFETKTFYIDELPSNNRYVGDVSLSGIYYLKGSGKTYYTIDLDPNSNTYGTHLKTLQLSQNISVHDWAFNAVDNKLYTLEKKTNNLYRIDPETGVVSNLGVVPILAGLTYTYGAVYFDASGRFYVSANETGTIYVIQSVQNINNEKDIDSNLFAFGPSSSSNDGARCPTAPVAQEICDNGIDDDGDGLIDCQDPSCSGYSGCPVIELAAASSANDGGLESNNRLSQQISKRNFKRTKRSYKFNTTTAKRITKPLNYGTVATSRSTGFQLSDFVPLEVINEDETIISTPDDLVDITNATEVYSVDYLSKDEAIASLLILETEDGVYEHTKYICDRLLGAELISVSTIEINEQKFIKSLIRNIDGSIEFVLSLSVKQVNNNADFAVESHWNLDKYENHVGFYNFQIWSSSLDNLFILGEELLRLIAVQKPIVSYNNSTPPTVFVRSGTYLNGKLQLQIVNTNKSERVVFDGGLRSTETEQVEYVSTNIDLSDDYISNIEVNAGNLFDIGFRIGDGIETPDDLFMSDGPWGYDDAAPTTTVTRFIVEPNETSFETDEYGVERNINLEAKTSEYIAAYRALTPKFTPIDLTNYKSVKLNAKGTGTLIVRLVKAQIDSWDMQYKTSIELTDQLNEYTLLFSDFKSVTGEALDASDITSVVFTMLADGDEASVKQMDIQHLRFSKDSKTLGVDHTVFDESTHPFAYPNPMQSQTKIHFTAQRSEAVELLVYNQVGALVKQIAFNAVKGDNSIELNRAQLSSGMYICKINSDTPYKTIKLLVK
ncbi:T9SS type A sorting domain-containing protein [Formosa sediminum]|uniref:T9SS type A sorting domain-containing protein n=1 Tax=Formosa sediminum TaxID=2594004 RepID=A0A516GSM4_9FLAO|nr:T9SS type A sorting domain-containing protein [Formosa sediminum]QDO94527.1 T9SS type A sorting domain-containing protein [Formosa sediminum]